MNEDIRIKTLYKITHVLEWSISNALTMVLLPLIVLNLCGVVDWYYTMILFISIICVFFINSGLYNWLSKTVAVLEDK